MLNRSLIDVERKSIQSVVKLRQLVAAFCRAGVRAPNRDVCSLAVTVNRSAGNCARAAEQEVITPIRSEFVWNCWNVHSAKSELG